MARAPLQEFLERLQKLLKIPGEVVTVCLADDRAMARWNKAYRRKQSSTDVLSFPPDETANGSSAVRNGRAPRSGNRRNVARGEYLGDIAISPAIARRNARRFERTLDTELRILILHGVLHLLGYDHETDKGEMERYENRLRARLGLQ
ncbi:MAG: rRNA maturation RNase YbeY [Candidatus Acidiferrales bacterium]